MRNFNFNDNGVDGVDRDILNFGLKEISSDVIVGLQYGDCAKGKVTKWLLDKYFYDYCVRYNGGDNAGHTIYKKGKKLVTHFVPAGAFSDLRTVSVIGPNCLLHVNKFFKELKYLNDNGINVNSDNIKISYNTHIITDDNILEDEEMDYIGSTKRGITFAYRDRVLKNSSRAEDIPELDDFICDPVQLFNKSDKHSGTTRILFEGAQGFGLDLSFGDYPYVTSSNCIASSAFLNGVSPKTLRKVYGCAKIYETYVGTKDFHGDGDIFNELQKLGNEYGATTGRSRQCNWLDLGLLVRAIIVNGVDVVIFSKVDVIKELNHFEIRNPNIKFSNYDDMEYFISERLHRAFPNIELIFSDVPHTV